MKNRFNWLWHNVTTFESYKEETKFDEPLMVGGKGSKQAAPNGIRYILKSLTPNARSIFKVLAEHQLANPKEGLSYVEFYQRSVQLMQLVFVIIHMSDRSCYSLILLNPSII